MRALRPDLLLGPLLSLAQLATANFGSGRPIPQVEAAVSLVESKLSAWYNFVADPASHSGGVEHGRPLARPPSEFWLGNIKHQGIAPFAGSGYKVFRNVLDYGAKGEFSCPRNQHLDDSCRLTARKKVTVSRMILQLSILPSRRAIDAGQRIVLPPLSLQRLYISHQVNTSCHRQSLTIISPC